MIKYTLFSGKKFCEERSLIINNQAGTAFFFDKNSLCLNPFSPLEHVDQNLVLSDFARVWSKELGLQPGGQRYLHKNVSEFNLKYPDENIETFIDWLSKKPEKSMDFRGYRDRLLVRLESVLLETGDIFRCQKGIDDIHFTKENIIIELESSAAATMSVVASTIFLRQFRLKSANPDLLQYKNFIVLEDIQGGLLWQEKSEFSSELSSYGWMVNEARYRNIHFCFLVQGVKLLPETIKEGSSIVISKRVNDTNEEESLSQLMKLNDEQKQCPMGLKKVDALFIDKEKEDVTVHIIVPEYPTQIITDEQIKMKQGHFINKITEGVIRSKFEKTETIGEDELSYQSKLIIEDLKKFPFDFQSEREIRLNINARIIAENLDELVLNGWLRRHESKINLGKGKGQFQPYIFTEKAVKEFGKQNIKGKGSTEHAFWQYRCAKYFTEKGYDVKIEYFPSEENNSGNKSSLYSIDVIAQNDYEKIAIEIELNDTPHIKDNILKCINEDFDRIIIAVYGAKLMKRIQRIALSNIEIEKRSKEGKIKIEMLSSFLN